MALVLRSRCDELIMLFPVASTSAANKAVGATLEIINLACRQNFDEA
jgi:hypothetical protein